MGRSLRVVVVEDSEDDTEMILQQLQEDGYEPSALRVETAETMRAALESRSWDLVIADYALPRFDALAALKLLHSSGLDLPFIIVSGVIGRTVGEEVAVEAMTAGAHDYILKSNLTRLGPAVERELREAQVRAERRQAQEALERLNADLERRIGERTAQLDQANRDLADAVVRERDARESAEATALRLRALQYVADAVLSELSVDELLGELLRRTRRVLCADTATVLLLTEDGQRLTVRASSGLEEVGDKIEIPIGRGIAGRIAATGKPLVVEDLSEAEAVRPLLRDKLRSLLGAPLKRRRRCIGVIHVGTLASRRFTEDDVRLMQLVADRVASAMERRQDEELMRKLSMAVEQSPVVVIVTDNQGRIEYVNPRFTELTGNSSDEVLGQNPRIFKSGYTSPEEYRELWQTITSGRMWRGHFQNRKKSGELYWESASIAPITNSEGTITHFVAVKQDITGRKQAEQDREHVLSQLKKANEQLAVSTIRAQTLAEEAERQKREALRREAELGSVVTAVADGLVIFDTNGEAIYSNPTAERMLGLSGDEKWSMAQAAARLRMETPEGKPFPVERMPIQRALRGESVRGVVMRLHPKPDITLWVSATAAPIYAGHGRHMGAVGTFADVTELHQVQDQLELSRQRMAETLHLIAHDVRQPPTSVTGMAQWPQRALDGKAMEREARSAEAILTNARRMNAMIQDLVESARLELGGLELHKERTDLLLLVSNLAERVGTQEDRARIRVEPAEPMPPPLPLDPNRLERAIVNLITNALKYSPLDTPVIVRVGQEDGSAFVSVTDQGMGISAADTPHLFERGFRTPEARGSGEGLGLGLGLYITHMLVQAHGGRVWVESEPGKGSTFHLTLPLA